MTSPVGALILSGGESSRMGKPKALLEIGGRTFLETIVDLASESGLQPVRVVVGNHGGEIATALPQYAPLLISNEHPELGQLSSLQIGLESMPDGVAGAMVFLVDHPCVRQSTIRVLLEAFGQGGGEIVIPACGDRRGHPVIFGRGVFADLLEAPLDQGARAVVRGRPESVVTVEVDDPGILKDIDTPAQYREMSTDE